LRFLKKVERIAETIGCVLRQPRRSGYHLFRLPETISAADFCDRWGKDSRMSVSPPPLARDRASDPINPLQSYADACKEGPGIWKWNHYFDIYHRHFQKFVGRDVHVVEVGVYSGGSLLMWKSYFGPKAHISGVDIEPACEVYEQDQISIHIGDQADRQFWRTFRQQAAPVDVIIDDGGHTAEQQMITLEEMLPHLRPGGVYLCEDLHGTSQLFSSYAYSLAESLNTWVSLPTPGEHASGTTPFQVAISSVHLYPFVVVIEKAEKAVDRFVAPKHGTQWQPFLR